MARATQAHHACMALRHDELTIWEIAFRWGGFDPQQAWIRIPVAVRDNVRLLLNGIYSGELECREWSHEMRLPGTSEVSPRYIGNCMGDVIDCIEGRRCKQAFLQQIHLERDNVQKWCDKSGLQFPAFWLAYPTAENVPPFQDAGSRAETGELAASKPRMPRPNPHKDAMRDRAREIWANDPKLSKIAVANRLHKFNEESVKPVTFETLLDWICDLDPRPPDEKRGRKRRTVAVESKR